MESVIDRRLPSSLTPLVGGFCLGESPCWFEGLLWFSDVLGEAVHTVNLLGSMTKLPVPGHAPSGLGFSPDGSLLIVSSDDRQMLRYDGETVESIADLSETVSVKLGDMVVDNWGRAYVTCQAHENGAIARIDPDGTVTLVAGGLDLPSGMAITADRTTLIVAESLTRRLTAFRIATTGELSERRSFAEGLEAPPAGIALDAEGGVWTSMPQSHQFQRIVAGGAVTDRIDLGDRTAIACALGGPERRVLFLLSSIEGDSQRLISARPSCLDAIWVDVPGVGLDQCKACDI